MKNIKPFKVFNESIDKEDFKMFDEEDISNSISDWWISIDEQLPSENKYVLVYTRDGDIDVAMIEIGISKKEREILKEKGDDRARRYKFPDEEGNNQKPYRWSTNGPVDYFGQEVLYWMPLPAPPQN